VAHSLSAKFWLKQKMDQSFFCNALCCVCPWICWCCVLGRFWPFLSYIPHYCSKCWTSTYYRTHNNLQIMTWFLHCSLDSPWWVTLLSERMPTKCFVHGTKMMRQVRYNVNLINHPCTHTKKRNCYCIRRCKVSDVELGKQIWSIQATIESGWPPLLFSCFAWINIGLFR
jgi:hypothetical protein